MRSRDSKGRFIKKGSEKAEKKSTKGKCIKTTREDGMEVMVNMFKKIYKNI